MRQKFAAVDNNIVSVSSTMMYKLVESILIILWPDITKNHVALTLF